SWSVTGVQTCALPIWSISTDVACSLAFSDDGLALAGALKDKPSGLRLWDALDGTERVHFPGDDGQLGRVAFSPDGRVLVAGGPAIGRATCRGAGQTRR